jgi:hypothetical protein
LTVALLIASGARSGTAHAGDPTLAWSIALDSAKNQHDSAWAVAVDAAADVVAAGRLGDRFTVVKRSGSTGTSVWQRQVNGTESAAATSATAVAVDGVGNVYAAGYLVNATASGDFAVVKLRGSDGAVLWTTATKAGRANALALDKGGDIVVAGGLGSGNSLHPVVMRLAHADGDVLWQQSPAGDKVGQAEAVVIDRQGNPIVVGFSVKQGNTADYSIFKLAIGTGQSIWHQGFTGVDAISDVVAVASGNDVVTGGTRDGHFTVIKLDGSSGKKLWEHTHGDGLAPPLQAVQIAFTSSGDVVASGSTTGTGGHTLIKPYVVMLKGSAGTAVWSHSAGKPVVGIGDFARAAVGPLDSVLAVGQDQDRIRVDKLDPSDGSQRWTWSASKASSAKAILFRDDSLFIAGTQGTATSGTDLLLLKLAIEAPCVKGHAGCGTCTPPCGPHEICVEHHCRIIDHPNPGGHTHTE